MGSSGRASVKRSFVARHPLSEEASSPHPPTGARGGKPQSCASCELCSDRLAHLLRARRAGNSPGSIFPEELLTAAPAPREFQPSVNTHRPKGCFVRNLSSSRAEGQSCWPDTPCSGQNILSRDIPNPAVLTRARYTGLQPQSQRHPWKTALPPRQAPPGTAGLGHSWAARGGTASRWETSVRASPLWF